MWSTRLTRRQQAFKKSIDLKLQQELKLAFDRKDQKVLEVQNKAINKINKLNIEYKYQKATQSMIHDWDKAQASSMIWALKYLWILARG